MAMAETKVTLVTATGNRKFSLEKAENILRIEAQHKFGDYALSERSPYEFVNGSLRRTGQSTTEQPQESARPD